MVSADLEGLVASHHKANLLGFVVLQQTDVAGPTLLPLALSIIEPEELRAPGNIVSEKEYT